MPEATKRLSNEKRLEKLRCEELRLQELLKDTLGPQLIAQTHQQLAKVERHIRIIEYRQTKRRAANQAKIVVGAIVMNLRSEHPGIPVRLLERAPHWPSP